MVLGGIGRCYADHGHPAEVAHRRDEAGTDGQEARWVVLEGLEGPKPGPDGQPVQEKNAQVGLKQGRGVIFWGRRWRKEG